MILRAENLSKKYNREWVIKDLCFEFKKSSIIAITGPNGSGKSTLLKLIAGYVLPSSGNINWIIDNKEISIDDQFRHLAVSAPYMQIVEELTLNEFLDFHQNFKTLRASESKESFLNKTGLANQGDKFIKEFSSGMKQRVKLGLCFYFENDLLLIDEGTTNLDKQGIEWFQNEVKNQEDRLVILFSNQEQEYSLAEQNLNLSKF
ncbi:MAG: ATP-binding cassette domain-containing protein [Cytophagales bacterium]